MGNSTSLWFIFLCFRMRTIHLFCSHPAPLLCHIQITQWMRYLECYIRQKIFVYVTQSFSDSCFSNSLKNIYVNIDVFRNESLYQPQDDSHLHYKSPQAVAAEPHSIAWEPLLFLINFSLCRGRNQFWWNTILKFLPALRWSTSPKGDQKSTIKCQRLQLSLSEALL